MQLRCRVDLGFEILPPRPRNGVATHGHDGGAAASEGGDDEFGARLLTPLSLGTVVLSWTPGKAQASKHFQTSSTSRMLDVRGRLRNATVAATCLGACELVRTVCVPELPVGPGDTRPQLAVVRRHRHVVVAARHFR